MIAVTPMPPAVQIEIRPRLALFVDENLGERRNDCALPVAAKGCPIAMLPPL
jgi:hypothetical protein